jgi:hypothetical protein
MLNWNSGLDAVQIVIYILYTRFCNVTVMYVV